MLCFALLLLPLKALAELFVTPLLILEVSPWGVNICYLEVPNELICLKFTLPLCKMFLESSTGGVWNSDGVAQVILYSLMNFFVLQEFTDAGAVIREW